MTPEGADRYETQVDAGIIAATNQDLVAMVRRGTFRADLYHRLATLRIHVPPLRERRGDIGTIVEQRLETLATESHARKLPREEWNLLIEYDWPGNVRQLIGLVDRAVLLTITMTETLDEEQDQEYGEVRGADNLVAIDFLPNDRRTIRSIADIQREFAERAWLLHDKNYTATARRWARRRIRCGTPTWDGSNSHTYRPHVDVGGFSKEE